MTKRVKAKYRNHPKIRIKPVPKRRTRGMTALAEKERKLLERQDLVPRAIPKIRRGWRVTYSNGRTVETMARREFIDNLNGYEGKSYAALEAVITHAERIWYMECVLLERNIKLRTATRTTTTDRWQWRAKRYGHVSLIVMKGMRAGIEWHHVRSTMMGHFDRFK